MVTVGAMINTVMLLLEETEFGRKFIKDTNSIKQPRKQVVHIPQLSTGSLVPIEESTGITISRIGKTELTILGAMSANDDDYDGDFATFDYWSNDGIKHSGIYTVNTTLSTNEVACVDSITGIAITDFYNVVPDSVVFSQAVKAGHDLKIGVTGLATPMITIEENDTTPDAANIHGVGDVYVRGIDNTASLQSKDTELRYFTPWGEQKFAVRTTGADGTTEVRYFVATSAFVATSVYVGDFYRPVTFITDTVPAATKNMFLTDSDCGNVNGTSGDIYGMIEEGIKEMLTTYFFAAPNRITYIHSLEIDVPAAAANKVTIQINFTPFGHPHQVALQHHFIGGTNHGRELNYRVEPDTDFYMSISDVATASTPSMDFEYIYGKQTVIANAAIVAGGV